MWCSMFMQKVYLSVLQDLLPVFNQMSHFTTPIFGAEITLNVFTFSFDLSSVQVKFVRNKIRKINTQGHNREYNFFRDVSFILGNLKEDLERMANLIVRSKAFMRKCRRQVS